MTWTGIDNVWAFGAVLAFLAANLAVTLLGQHWGHARASKVDAKTDEIHRQTVNDHRGTENLRDQIDRIEATQDAIKAAQDAAQAAREIASQKMAEIHRYQIHQARDLSGLRDEFGGLRRETRDGRADHADLLRRLNAFVRREHPDADPL